MAGIGIRNGNRSTFMSIFGTIISAIFGSKAGPAGGAAVPQSDTTTGASGSAGPVSRATVEAQLSKIAQARGGQYNWQTSIVDLMKLLELDSGLGARKQLAQELGYTGALDGSAEMNIWLHKQVMDKVAESGGRVPESLKH
jgi:hypothetical protein